MFDAGFLEVLIIGIIALLVVGPERLPGVAKKVGGWIGKARAFVDATKADIEREINASEMRELLESQKKEIDELRNMMDEGAKDFSQQAADVKNSIQSGMDSMTSDSQPTPGTGHEKPVSKPISNVAQATDHTHTSETKHND